MILIAPNHLESSTGRLIETETAANQAAISGKYPFKEGDVLYSKIRPYLRKAYLAEFSGICSADMYPLKTQPTFDSRLLLHVLLSDRFTHFANTQSARTGFPKINREEISEYALALPLSTVEQKLIAAVLDTWDTAISKTYQLVAQKEQRKKALMQQLLTGKRRLSGFNEAWRETHLGDCFTERNEVARIDLPLLSITADRGVILQSESDKKDTSNEDKAKYKRICAGDIGYNTMRMWQGRSALSGLEGLLSPAYTIVTPREKADVLFFSYLFKTPKLIHLFFRQSQGLVDDTLNCKYPDFSSVRVKVPASKNEQIAIAEVLQDADKEIQLLGAKLDALKQQKTGLMQKLLTGQIRVRTE